MLIEVTYDCNLCRVSEERFWHNYFYRVFLIKQSSQLATLASGRGAHSAQALMVLSCMEEVLLMAVSVMLSC